MPEDLTKLKTYLRVAQDGSLSEGQLSEFVQLARAIVQGYLGHVRYSITYLCSQQGMTSDDLAYDCVAEAFGRDERNKFPYLESFIDSLTADLAALPDHDILLAFRSFITSVAEAQLARLYALADPTGSRIHRNIRICLKDSPLFNLAKESRGLVLRPRECDSLDHLDEFPLDDLAARLPTSRGDPQTIPDLVKLIHETLMEQDTYRRSIALTDVV